MKVKVSILLLILISFLNMGAVSNKHIINNSFKDMETSVINKSQFKENGVKIQFKIKKDIKTEYLIVKENLMNNIKGIYKEIDKNKFEILNNDFNVNINLWNVDNYTYVEVILININPQYKTIHLKKILKELKNKDTEDMQTFLYYKGEINQEKNKNFVDEVINLEYLKDIDVIEINNGYTGTGILKSGEKVNFALANYNTNSYIIIGTPIIFTTY
ncbi:hypothetical protein [Clostridium uliginosum]|uniref:TATA-box binding n=1 Tax=Clostridium uliginosum TaxID=119641 RepID=A0A1I1IGE8_9CLOT|nr:hypothetical protein [Clostridium uliginosum]SFC32833.1 hypothetical protein SAMN05421842_102194 [Clostridium uliginosum]